MTWWRGVLSGCAVLALIVGCSRIGDKGVAAASLLPEAKRQPAPYFTLKDSNAQNVRLSAYKGKVVLVNFWETWCAPCRIEIPWFIEFERQYKDRGFAVLGIALDADGWSVVRPYMQEKRINYRIVLGNDKIAQLYGGVEALPTTVVVDRKGRIAATHVGLIGKKEYQSQIEQLLGSEQTRSVGTVRTDCVC
jgi:cytochrome c biogenesis protein CcmG/thiol:disulfide interchange protein DsbE